MFDAEAVKELIENRRTPQVCVATEGLKPYALVPEGYQVKPLADLRTTLDRVAQKVVLLTADDFIAYWKRFADVDSVIFADERSAKYLAIVDYHTAMNSPAWCDHQATYQCPASPEWQIWSASNGKAMNQAHFASFIEDNYPDVIRPSHAEMLQVSTNLIAKKSVNFAQATRLDNGQSQLTYQEDVKGSVEVKGGSMKVPDTFTIQVPIYLGGEAYKVEARLRYRIDDGRLAMWYDLHRPHKAVETATRAVTDKIRKALEAAPFYLGAPA